MKKERLQADRIAEKIQKSNVHYLPMKQQEEERKINKSTMLF